MSFRNTAMTKSNISKNRLFMVCMKRVGAYVRPMGMTTHFYRLYIIRNAIFRLCKVQVRDANMINRGYPVFLQL